MRGNEELIKNFYHRVKTAIDKGWPLDPNGIQAERCNQQNQRNAKYIKFRLRGLKPTGLKKAYEYLIENLNATWDAFQTQITSTDVSYTISSQLVPNATSHQNTNLHSLEQQIKELTAFFKEQQMKQVNQSNSRPANADNKSRQNMTKFCSYCRRIGHTLMYFRTKAFDDQNKNQKTRNSQERHTVSTHDYKKRRGPNFGSQNNQNFNQQPRYGNQNNQTPYRQTSFNLDKTDFQTQMDKINQIDRVTLGATDPTTGSKLSIISTLDQRSLILSTTKTFHRITTYLHSTHFNSLTIRDKM